MQSGKPLIILVSGVCLAVACWYGTRPGVPRASRSALGSDLQRARLEQAGYTGSSECRDCHQRFYALWDGSRHQLAMQPYSETFAKQRLVPQVSAIRAPEDGALYVAETGPAQGRVRRTTVAGDTVFPIRYVLGGKNVCFFLTPLERGRLQTLPVAFNVKQNAWYYASSAADAGHSAENAKTRPVHWTDRVNAFNTSCFGCHVSQMSTRYDAVTDTYETHWAEPGINCEACHGPGEQHVKASRAATPGHPPNDLRIVGLRNAPGERVDSLCASCHAKMSPISASFSPGEPFFDHYDLTALESGDFYPDGRDLGENYTLTSWRLSPCVKAGQLHCMHCHTSSGRYRFAARTAANDACASCHRAVVASGQAHTHHAPSDRSPRCIDCHMPVTTFAHMTRTDHSMRPPVPEATRRYGSPNACTLCHTERQAEWAQEQVVRWRKATRQVVYLRQAELIEQARRRDWRHVDQMLAYLQAGERDEIVAVSLVRLLRSCPSAAKWPVLVSVLARDPSPLVRAAAAEHLGDSLTPETIRALVKGAGDTSRLVRVRAAASLASVDMHRLDLVVGGQALVSTARASVEQATNELMAGLLVRADQPASHFNLGNILSAKGRNAQAVDAYRTAIRLQADFVPAFINMAMALNAQGSAAEAHRALTQALTWEPNNTTALTNLGLLSGEQGHLGDAESCYRKAWALDPTSSLVAYNLALVLAERRPTEALSFAEKATALSPDEPRYAYAYAFQLDRNNQSDKAVRILGRLIERGPVTADPYALLGSILERTQRRPAAAAVYLRASDNLLLPKAQRESFLRSAARLGGR